MAGQPVRLAIASAHDIVAHGLRSMLAEHGDRVVVVDHDDESAAPDVVIHDRLDGTEPVGWVSVGASIEEVLALVEAAASGRLAAGTDGSAVDEADGRASLTPREVEVLRLITEGLSNQEIADRIFISINSVKTYVRSAYRKIGVRSRSQAVAWCLTHDLG